MSEGAAAGDAEASAPRTTGKRPAVRRQLLQGAAVEVAGYGITQVVRLGANLILARLLFPAAFGLMAMLTLVLVGMTMLTDVGISQAVIRSDRGDDPRFLDTAWTIQATRGLLLWIGAIVLAWPVSALFREPSLLTLIPVGGASAFLQGLASTRILTMRRQLRPFPIVSLEIGSQLLGVGLMIGLAFAGVGVWSLVAGSLLGAAAHSALSYALPGVHRPRLRIEPAARHEIIHFGRWIYASSAVSFAAARGDQLVLGRLLGAASLGLYNIGLALAELPDAIANRVIAGILYPLYSRVHNETPQDLARLYFRTRLALDAVLHTTLGGLIALAPLVIRILYDPRYHGAIPMLQVLAFRTSLGLMTSPLETVLFSKGFTFYGFRRNATVAVGNFVAMPVGYWLGGPLGLLWGSTVSRVAAIGALWPAARRHGILRVERELLWLPFLAGGYGIGRVLLWMLTA